MELVQLRHRDIEKEVSLLALMEKFVIVWSEVRASA